MIKKLIMMFFRFEFEMERKRILSDAQEFLDKAKANNAEKENRVQYITYERFEITSSEFLHGMQPVFNNSRVISWLNGHKNIYVSCMKDALRVGRKDDVIGLANQITTIDVLLDDLSDFKNAYVNMLETKKEEQSHVTR